LSGGESANAMCRARADTAAGAAAPCSLGDPSCIEFTDQPEKYLLYNVIEMDHRHHGDDNSVASPATNAASPTRSDNLANIPPKSITQDCPAEWIRTSFREAYSFVLQCN
jgi:hypothetical protein